ncbi:MAG: M14 family zinc carboxypeptidase [Actinomycetota bacterium]
MRRTVAILIMAAVVLSAAPTGASPVCADEPRLMCGGRIFPEAESTASFVQHDNGEFASGIQALEDEFPRFVRVSTFSQALGREAVSFEGRDLWLVEITDFNVPEADKIPVVISLSVHGPERAGLEGGVRYMEDLARWLADDPDHKLRNGTNKDSIARPVSEVFEKVHLYLADINPDGWANGDAQNGGVFERGNGNGVDLNREFPTMGWSYPPYTALSEPESKAWAELVGRIDPVVTADLHGELTSAQNAFADMMIPAGEWNPIEQARQERAARHMKSNVERYFRRDQINAGEASGVAGMKPAEYATGYDVVGYDAAGFMGDWFTQEFGAVDMDVEHFLSHLVPNSTWVHALEDAHIASVRGEIESLVVEALVTRRVRVRLPWRRTGYVRDRRVVTSRDGYGGPKPPDGITPKPYRVTRMRYFRDVARLTPDGLRAVGPRRIARGGLHGLRTLVIADGPFGGAFKGRPKATRRAARTLETFVRRGGNLVLTDKAIKLLVPMGIVGPKAVKRRFYNAGHINIDDFSDAYTRDVHTTASQTYYEVPLGFSIDEDASPHWIVLQRPWRKAGGKKVAHIEEDNHVGVGRMKLGRGTIGIFGAVLPQPTEKFDHFYGLANYALSVAGGQILNNMVTFRRR